MMDFVTIRDRTVKKGVREVYPEFKVKRSGDLMVRGKSFYAVWDEEKGLWSTDEYDAQRLIDQELANYSRSIAGPEDIVSVKYMGDFSTNSWLNFRNYVSHISDNYHQLDNKLCFQDTNITKKDYISRRLPYSLIPGDYSAFDEILGTLYDPKERQKIEWAIGSIISGDSKDIQKFLVFYGEAGSGKSTILNIVQKLFEGYYVMFDAKALTSNNNAFSTEVFRSNPLVAIQHDGDLSRIEDNTKLNSIVSHEEMVMNEKFKSSYTSRANCFLFMATNRPVKITDAKSGVIRRLIDVKPSLRKIPAKRYQALMSQIDFELGGIACHCLDIYRSLGKHYYDAYEPTEMKYKTDEFFNFVEDSYFDFIKEDGISLKAAYERYKGYLEKSGATKRLLMYQFREELKNYFNRFDMQTRIDGQQVRSWYSGFKKEKFEDIREPVVDNTPYALSLEKTESLLDILLADQPAQYAVGKNDTPKNKWSDNSTTLKELDTSKTHYVKIPKGMIVIDFDLKNDKGEKDIQKNLEAASKWPPTYAEFSKGGSGIHLHYMYDGDTTELAAKYAEDIEIKVYNGNSSLRRRLSYCNDIPVATISSGLPRKEKKVVNKKSIENVEHLYNAIHKALRKEIEPGATRTCIDYIEKVLNDAYEQGLQYDVTPLRPKILAFAAHSSHQASYCITRVSKMKFKSEDLEEKIENYSDERLAFFDIEIFPNLFLLTWKYAGDDYCTPMFNPKPKDIEPLLNKKLVGFNCRRYDNHILYAAYLGYTNEQLYDISQKIINGSKNAMFSDAYNLSYTDVYDFCAKKQSLKKWEIELGIHHQELGFKWDEPVPEDKWPEVAKYCENDVYATEAVFNDRQSDFIAREILADLAGMTVNDTTNSLTTKIIFGTNRTPQASFNYRDMGDIRQVVKTEGSDAFTAFDEFGRPIFPGYKYESGVSTYRGEEVGEGGYVYSEPGMWRHVALLDIASMHPSSIVAEQLFGEEYTKRFSDILQARIYIKHKQFDKAKELFDGKLAGYLTDEKQAKALSGALKIAINSVYGLTSAKFDNPFRDLRNIDNIVAKRGALFMVNLKHEVQAKGFTVAHIKTDSIKIPNATPDIIKFVMEYGKKYGYNFEHEATYDRMCLVNDAVYIARFEDKESCEVRYGYIPDENNEHGNQWTATGTQFQIPYVFKTLFSKEPIEFQDLCETKTVSSALYLDFNEGLPDVSDYEDLYQKTLKNDPGNTELLASLEEKIAKGHNYIFVGKAGLFNPILPGFDGGLLMREKDGKYYSAGGTKGYRWKEAEVVRNLGLEDTIDIGYFDKLASEAVKEIGKYVDFDEFVNGDPQSKDISDRAPWDDLACGTNKYSSCLECPHWKRDLGNKVDEAYYCDLDQQLLV